MKYMLDTSICIYIIKKDPIHVYRKFNTLSSDDELCVSSISYSELMYGIEKGHHKQKNKEALNEFILPLEILPFDDQVAEHYGIIRTRLMKTGTPIDLLDFLIAAHALSVNATLVTHNIKEFARIPHLKIEDWIET